MPDDENYQINQHPWLVLTVITPAQAPDTDVMSLSRSNVQCGPPGLLRADPTQAVVAGRSLSGRNYNSPPHRLSTLHWEHYPHRILRHCTKQESLLTSCTHCSPQNFDALCFAACLSFYNYLWPLPSATAQFSVKRSNLSNFKPKFSCSHRSQSSGPLR